MWSMPRPVLKVVAVLIGLCALGGFVMGVRGAPEKARLPGEAPPGVGSAAELQATDAKPLGEELPLPPPPVVAKVEEKRKPEEKKRPADPLDRAADQTPSPTEKAAAVKPSAPKPAPAEPDDRVGDLLDGVTPVPEDPPI